MVPATPSSSAIGQPARKLTMSVENAGPQTLEQLERRPGEADIAPERQAQSSCLPLAEDKTHATMRTLSGHHHRLVRRTGSQSSSLSSTWTEAGVHDSASFEQDGHPGSSTATLDQTPPTAKYPSSSSLVSSATAPISKSSHVAAHSSPPTSSSCNSSPSLVTLGAVGSQRSPSRAKSNGSLYITQEERELVKNLPRVHFSPSSLLTKLDSPTITPNDDLTQTDRTDPPQSNLLKPPALDKNFLISPPGSPPVGWEQVVEDAPNQKSLAEDLCQRLRFLSVGNEEDEGEGGDEEGEVVVLQAQSELNLPALKIQHSERTTKRPGMNIGLVKATLESMVSNRISPTPRPALSN